MCDDVLFEVLSSGNRKELVILTKNGKRFSRLVDRLIVRSDCEEEKGFKKELFNQKTGDKLLDSFNGSRLEIVKVNGQELVADGKRDDKRKVTVLKNEQLNF